MADPRPIFWILDDGSNEGVAPHSRVEGDTPSAKKGLIGFSFKDSSGNLVLPQLTAQGQVKVTMDASGVQMDDHGEVSAGSLSLTDVATITLANSKTYIDVGAMVCCLRESLFQIILNDNAVETVLSEMIVGPGQFSMEFALPKFEFVSGATGTQELKIKAKNFEKLSSLRATVSCIEVQP